MEDIQTHIDGIRKMMNYCDDVKYKSDCLLMFFHEMFNRVGFFQNMPIEIMTNTVPNNIYVYNEKCDYKMLTKHKMYKFRHKFTKREFFTHMIGILQRIEGLDFKNDQPEYIIFLFNDLNFNKLSDQYDNTIISPYVNIFTYHKQDNVDNKCFQSYKRFVPTHRMCYFDGKCINWLTQTHITKNIGEKYIHSICPCPM